MRFDREPDRSRTPSPPPFDDENNDDNDDQSTELLNNIEEKQTQMKITEDLIIEKIQQMEITLNQLRQVNHLLEQFVILEQKINK